MQLVPTSCKLPKDVTSISAKPICQSHFSDVWRGKLDGRDVAIKALRLHADEVQEVKKVGHTWFIDYQRADMVKAYLHELVLWQCLRHKNIVPFIGVCKEFEVSLVSEWMAGGTIIAFLHENPNRNRESFVCSSLQIICILAQLVHTDSRC
jgi:serine/threonine protein kinase